MVRKFGLLLIGVAIAAVGWSVLFQTVPAELHGRVYFAGFALMIGASVVGSVRFK